MNTSLRALAAVLSLSAAATLAGCAGDAESAADDQSARLEPPAIAEQTAALESAPATEPPASAVENAPATEPAGAMEPTPAPRAERRRPTPRPAVAPGTTAEPEVPAAPEPAAAFIAEGTSIGATVDEELSTERSREGDRFLARTTEDVLGANGEVLLPVGSVLNGRVTTSHASTGPDDLAALEVEIESITADGRTLPVRADVLEIETEVQARDSNTRTAAKVGIGAAAGAVIGRILGSDKGDAAKGAAVGAVAGAAVAATTRSGHAVVKPGARMTLQLTERLIVSR
jgi:hypothetical protein